MQSIHRRFLFTMALAAAVVGGLPVAAGAQAVITNGDGVALGVNEEGHLNFADPTGAIEPYNAGAVGVAYFTDYGTGDGAVWGDATAPGCFCEGYGVAATSGGTTYSGFANVDTDNGANNLTVDSFSSTASTAESTVHLTDLAGLTIEHDYHPSTSPSLYEATVTITNNTGSDITDLLYRRVMDWDIPPTTFSELVTLQGAGLGDLVDSCNNGFETADPTVDCTGLGFEDVNFVDAGPADHGALFTFNFGTLADGESKTFQIYYGAAGSEAAALAALALVGAEGIYSFGQCNPDFGFESCTSAGAPATFIFGFGGVGAPPIGGSAGGSAPEPATLLLLGGGVGAGLIRRYRRARG